MRDFWLSLGCRVLEMSPSEHDEVLAYTSHLPHALATALASSVPTEWLPLTAGTFRDCTRVAAADTAIWTAIFRDNRGPLLKAIATAQECLDAFKYALMTDDEEAIRQWWVRARNDATFLIISSRQRTPRANRCRGQPDLIVFGFVKSPLSFFHCQ